MKLLKLGSVVMALTLLPVGAIAQEAPNMLLNWRDTSLSNEDCVRRAQDALISERFKNGGVVRNSRGAIAYGFNGGYHGAIRCLADRNIAVFVVTGASSPRAVALGNNLTKYWDSRE
ncbi:MAG: hypothetical protein DCF19_21500 [Pseudanabaena frigida]|uniref:Uncharacterized protein n=1 Tax=Pseudanabaena frigida TaxID=945775 RepID=A0A2W4XYM6_9CYAN|nr:MAG: hypothetical protein DCF19_21500 [Pseudanabaena frigida]